MNAATPGQAALSLLAEVLDTFRAASVVGGQLKGDAVSCVGMSDLRRWREQAAALAAQPPQPAPGVHSWAEMSGTERKLEIALTALDEIHVANPSGTHAHDTAHAAMDRMSELPERKPAPELAAARFDAEQAREALSAVMAEHRQLRELVDEIGVMAANAPEDGDSFAVCEEIAMRIAAHGIPEEPSPESLQEAGSQPEGSK